MAALVALADSIYLAIDPGELDNRVKKISDAAASDNERAAAYRQSQEEAPRDQIPDTPSSVN